MELKMSKNLQIANERSLEDDEEFLRRVTSGKSLYDEYTEYETINNGTFIYPMSKVREIAKDQYNNIISAKIVGNVNGTKLVEIELERLVPLEKNPYYR